MFNNSQVPMVWMTKSISEIPNNANGQLSLFMKSHELSFCFCWVKMGDGRRVGLSKNNKLCAVHPIQLLQFSLEHKIHIFFVSENKRLWSWVSYTSKIVNKIVVIKPMTLRKMPSSNLHTVWILKRVIFKITKLQIERHFVAQVHTDFKRLSQDLPQCAEVPLLL